MSRTLLKITMGLSGIIPSKKYQNIKNVWFVDHHMTNLAIMWSVICSCPYLTNTKLNIIQSCSNITSIHDIIQLTLQLEEKIGFQVMWPLQVHATCIGFYKDNNQYFIITTPVTMELCSTTSQGKVWMIRSHDTWRI